MRAIASGVMVGDGARCPPDMCAGYGAGGKEGEGRGYVGNVRRGEGYNGLIQRDTNMTVSPAEHS